MSAEVRKRIENELESVTFFDGFDEALIGISHEFGREPRAVYDYEICIDLLLERDEMDVDAAHEYFEYNVLGAYVGEHTPSFIRVIEDDSFLPY